MMSNLERKSKKRAYDRNRPRSKKQTVTYSREYGQETDLTIVEAVSEDDARIKLQEYQKSEIEIAQVRLLVDNPNKEFFMNGRIDTHHVADIIKTRNEAAFLKKVPAVASRSANAEYIIRNTDCISEAYRWVEETQVIQFSKVGTIIYPEKHYICSCVDGISEDGSCILFIEQLRIRNGNKITETAQSGKRNFPLKAVEEDLLIIDKDIHRKVQAALHVTGATQAIVVFYNHSTDIVSVKVTEDQSFWASIESKLERFFRVFVKYLVAKSIKIN